MAFEFLLNHSSAGSRGPLTCPLCQDVFTSPKLLPCFHTFCKHCLEDLVRHTGASRLVCPTCRAPTRVPPGGVGAFQTNFYIDTEDLDRMRTKMRCRIHHPMELDLFCKECDTCRSLCASQREVTDCMKALRMSITGEQQEESRAKKFAAIENVILKRSAIMTALVEERRDELLALLKSSQVNSELNTCAETPFNSSRCHSDLHNFTCINAIKREFGHDNIWVTKNETSRRRFTHYFLNTKARTPFIAKEIQSFFGCLDTMEVEITEPEVTTTEQFRYEARRDEEISSLCPLDDGNEVWISYGSYGLKNRAPSKKFDKFGRLRLTSKSANGRGSFKSVGSGESLFAEESESLRLTYSKTQRDKHIILSNYCKGTASVKRVKVTSEDPFDTKQTLKFKIKVGPHCAFDADSTGKFCAVVEDSETLDSQRKVHLFHCEQESAVATYNPPTPQTQPSDVCFYKLGGKEVLIVSDEGTDTLHVVEFGDKQLEFKRYLDPICPLLVQPAALNTDTTGRLWIACRGGSILTMTPISGMHSRHSSPTASVCSSWTF